MTFDATVGGANATSFCSVAQADAYHAAHVWGSDWTGTDEEKEVPLMHATRIIVAVLKPKGKKAASTQALPFPASGIYDENGDLIPSDVIPQGIINATAELARLIKVTNLEAVPESAGIGRMKAGPVELEINPPDRTALIPDSVRIYLRPFGQIRDPRKPARMRRVVRA